MCLVSYHIDWRKKNSSLRTMHSHQCAIAIKRYSSYAFLTLTNRYIVNIIAPENLETQGARASKIMILI